MEEFAEKFDEVFKLGYEYGYKNGYSNGLNAVNAESIKPYCELLKGLMNWNGSMNKPVENEKINTQEIYNGC